MKKYSLDKIMKKVSSLFSSISWKKILTFFIFIIIATILWFMQIYNKEFETTITLPIKYTDIPDSIVIQNTLPDQIHVKLKDYGLAMFSYHYFRKDTLRINVKSLVKSVNSSRITLQGATLDQYLRSSISDKSQILNYTPIMLTISYAPLAQKKLPIIFDGTVDLPPGYLLTSDITISPDSVMAYGSEKDLNKLLFAYTNVDTIRDVESDKKISVDLRPIPNVKTDIKSIEVSIKAEAYVQRSIEVPVKCINLPNNETVKFFPSKVKVLFFCGISQVEQININDFDLVVDYSTLKEPNKVSVPVRMRSTPDYARNITIVPANVEFIFEHQ